MDEEKDRQIQKTSTRLHESKEEKRNKKVKDKKKEANLD